MKYILLLAIILVAFARRSHQPDAVLSCLQGPCKEQFEACDNDSGCMKQLKQCMQAQQNNPLDYDTGFQCLQKKQTAFNAFQCIATQCLGMHGV